jgi:radical SAM protein with 4Fe4S-binding SPASM domain
MYAMYIDARNFAGTLSLRKLINYFRVRAMFYIRFIMRGAKYAGMPVSVSIEPTTSCSLSCPECPGGSGGFSRPQGNMELPGFQDIIEQLKGHLMVLMLYFQGEPLLNPDFFRMVAFARKNRIYTATSTNAQQLSDENSRKLVESGLDRLIISLDGIDQATYEKYRVGGDLEKVKEGVRNIMKWKKKLRSSRPYVIIQFLVFKANEHQLKAVKDLSRSLGADKLKLKTAQVYGFKGDTELIPENSKYSRYSRGADGNWKLKKLIRNRCFRMWSGVVITWDGMVVPCCFDKDASHQLGKLDEHSFKEIWKSKAYKEFRKQIFENRSKIDICSNCTE